MNYHVEYLRSVMQTDQLVGQELFKLNLHHFQEAPSPPKSKSSKKKRKKK